MRSPQGCPAYIQAGGSPRGREFAAKHADSIIATTNGIEGMRRYRDDMRGHAEREGRDPDSIKVLFLVARWSPTSSGRRATSTSACWRRRASPSAP